MKFEFAKATDITRFSKTKMGDFYKQYENIYITPDTNDYHILRILKGYGENYEEDPDKFILEHQKISKPKKEMIRGAGDVKRILDEDDGGNYSYKVTDSIEECVSLVDGGFGIN